MTGALATAGSNRDNRIKLPAHLVALPAAVLELMEVCRDEDRPLSDLAGIVAKDAALAAQVMRMANSAYFGLAIPAATLDKAVIQLGAETIRNIALTAAVLEVFQRTRVAGFDLNRFWRHSLSCADLARRLAEGSGRVPGPEAFLAGLLHDIGQLVLLANFPAAYAELTTRIPETDRLMVAERATFGTTHAEVGAWFIEQWNLKSLLADAVRYHHEDPIRLAESFPLLKIVATADILARADDRISDVDLDRAGTLINLSPLALMALREMAAAEVDRLAATFNLSLTSRSQSSGGKPAGPERGAPARDPDADSDEEPAIGPDRDLAGELQKSTRRQALLTGIIQGFLQARSRQDVVDLIYRGLDILFGVGRIIVFLTDAEGRNLGAVAHGGSRQTDLFGRLRLPLGSGRHLAARALTAKSPLALELPFEGGEASIADEQLLRLLKSEAALACPLSAQGRDLGVVLIGATRDRIRTIMTQRHLLNLFAGQAGLALYVREMTQLQSRRIIQERQEASAAMAHLVVHEVNNPLGIIKNYLTILRRKLSGADPAREDLRIIGEEVDRIAQIILKLKSGGDGPAGRNEPVMVNEVIKDILKILNKSLLIPAGIKARARFDPQLPPIRLDKNALIQVVINLVKNAAEALGSGGNIQVETRRGTVPEEGLILTIGDDGPGLPAAIRTRLFQPANTSKGPGHSGLGLSIVHGLVGEMKGRIEWSGRDGSGTTFTIILPLEAEEVNREA